MNSIDLRSQTILNSLAILEEAIARSRPCSHQGQSGFLIGYHFPSEDGKSLVVIAFQDEKGITLRYLPEEEVTL